MSEETAEVLGRSIAHGVVAGIPEYMMWIPSSIHMGGQYASSNPQFANEVVVLNQLYDIWWARVVRYYVRAMIEFHNESLK